MEKALYDPEDGYYSSGQINIGKKGDFFTNVSVGKIYGRILAHFFQEVWQKLGEPQEFTIVEQGAHEGQLALDILETIENELPKKFASSTRYQIVEPFYKQQQRQKEKLQHISKVAWFTQNDDLPSFIGVHFSNELIDAFPVDILFWDGSSWLEKRIQKEDNEFSWIKTPIKDLRLQHIAKTLPNNLAPGFLWEIRSGVKSWLRSIKYKMKSGMILIADYGFNASDRFASYRAEGSIACYENHHRFDNPLERVGRRDISTHVDFTDLAMSATELGWSFLGYSDQHHFLIGAAEAWLRSCEGKTDAATQKEWRLLQTLLHPETMGRQFKFLGLGKEIDIDSKLSGFRYERPGLKGLQV